MAYQFFDKLMSAAIKLGLQKVLQTAEQNQQFRNDLKSFISHQQRETHLDIFKFAERRHVKQDDEFIPLEKVYIPLRLNQLKTTLPGLSEYTKNPDDYSGLDKQKIENLSLLGLLDLIGKNDRFESNLLIGTAGSGKSTFMKYLTLLFSADKERQVQVFREEKNGDITTELEKVDHFHFPVFLRLRDLETELKKHGQANWEDNFSLETFFKLKYNINFETAHFYTYVFRYLPCIFLFDGIDEIPEHKVFDQFVLSRDKVSKWIIHQLKGIKGINPQAKFILTSRPTDTTMLGKYFQVFQIQKFNPIEIRQFTDYWYTGYGLQLEYQRDNATNERIQKHCKEALGKLDHNQQAFLASIKKEPLKNLVENPLLLSLTLLIHSVDESLDVGDTEKLYEQFIQTLLYRWDDVRGMDFFPFLAENAARQYLYEIVFRLAFHFSKEETTDMPVRGLMPALITAIRRFNRTTPEEDLNQAAKELLNALRDRSSGLFTAKEISDDFNDTIFEFQHKSFQDYLTALAIHQDALLQNGQFSLEDKMGSDFWDKTLEFYVNTGNPDFFFSNFIRDLEAENPSLANLHYFVQYFLLARNRAPELESQLASKLVSLLIRVQNPNDIERIYHCLLQLQLSEEDTIHLQDFFKKPALTIEAAYCSGKIALLLSKKGHYASLRETLLQKMENFASAKTPNNFWEIFHLSFLPFLYKDWQLLKSLLVFFPTAEKGYQATIYLALRDLRYLRDLRDLLDLLDLWDSLYLRDLRDLRDLRYLRDLLDFRDLRDLRDLRALRDLRDLENIFFKSWSEEYAKPAIKIKIDELIQNNLAILENLSEAEKRSIFDYY